MRSLRTFFGGKTRTLAPLAGAVLTLVAGTHCSSSSPAPTTTDDAGSDAADAVADVPVVPDAAPDTFVPDAGPVTCTKQPSFGLAIRVSHNPDALRNVATASVAGLPDGKVLVVFAEAIDTGGRYAIYARTVDPATSTASEDERLDVDADNLNAGPGLRLTTLDNGAIVAQWRGNVGNGNRLRIYQHGKWSPEALGPDGAMTALDADSVSFAGAPDGSVMVVRARATTAPLAAAAVYHPDEGGPRGSWSLAQTLDLDAGTGAPFVKPSGRPDGTYVLMIWHGAGGPAVRTRSPSGAWSMPSARSDVGARTAQPDARLLDDGSIVLVGLEGAGDTRQVVTSTWTAAAGWTPARLLSKLPTANGVVPFRGSADPYLFTINGSKVEFVAWVAGCATVAKDCEFHAVTRVYDGGASPPAWGDPVDLQIGPVMNGADYANVVALDGKHPLALRGNLDANEVDFKARLTDAWSPGSNLLGGPAGFFDGGIKSTARFFGGTFGLYSLVGRVDTTPKAIVSLMGKVTPSASPSGAWNPVSNAGSEMRTSSTGGGGTFVDGAGGFTIASNDATDGTTTIPLLAHDFGTGSPPAIVQVISADEQTANFASVPSIAPRDGGQDRSAIFLVAATPTGSTGPNRRLRAYAFNGQGTSVVQKQLANETRGPKSFPQSVLSTGCGGAIAYAVDPADGSHALELVLVQ
jgi:hypothetical protein